MTPEERAAQLAESWYSPEVFEEMDTPRQELAFMVTSTIHAAVAEAVAGEREACAVVADDLALIRPSNNEGYIVACMIATEIRARSRGEG